MSQIRSMVFLIPVLWGSAAVSAEDMITVTSEQQQAFGITVSPLRSTTEVLQARLPAEVVVPNDQLRVVSAWQPGLIEVLRAAEGETVTRGQALARIQSPQLLELQREFLQTLTRLRLAKTALDRDRQLVKDGIIPQRRFLETRSQYEEHSTALNQERESLRLSGMDPADIRQLEQARTLTSTLTVRSPLDGVVLEQMVVAGQRVEAATPLYRVGRLDPLWLEIHAPLARAEKVTVGDRIVLPKYRTEGHVITVGRAVHAADQGVLIRAEINKGAERLRPGQFVEAQIASGKGDVPLFRLARSALVRIQDNALIFVQTREGFRGQEVVIVKEEGDEIVIRVDLPEGTPVASTGTAALKAALTGLGGEG